MLLITLKKIEGLDEKGEGWGRDRLCEIIAKYKGPEKGDFRNSATKSDILYYTIF